MSANRQQKQYLKLDPVEAFYANPDVHCGGGFVDMKFKDRAIYDIENNEVKIVKSLTYNIPLAKMFDEILVNAVDCYLRNEGVSEVDITITDQYVNIKNNIKDTSKQIPIDIDKRYNQYYPEYLFTELNSGSNYSKTEATGGKNGIGAKLTSILSKKFQIDIVNNNKRYEQTIENKTYTKHPPKITSFESPNYTSITYYPNFEEITPDHRNKFTDGDIQYMYSRIYDMSIYNIKFTVNNISIPHLDWAEFAESFNISDELFHYISSPSWNNSWYISIGLSTSSLKRISYTNDVNTYDGGSHIEAIIKKLQTELTKRKITTTNLKSKLAIICRCSVKGASYDSQAKTKLKVTPKQLPKLNIDNFISNFIDQSNLVPELMGKLYDKKNKETASTNPKSIDGYLPALKYKRQSNKCTLFICEGLSAKSMCVRGIQVLGGNDYYGCYPLGGKPLNTRNASIDKYLANQHITDLKVILGLKDGTIYDSSNINTLNYRHVVCVKDADADGAAIMGLVINFFSTKFPSLLTSVDAFFYEFISPMVKVYTKDGLKEFYNDYQYQQYLQSIESSNFIRDIKFIKGLAANDDNDVKRYFREYNDNRLQILFSDDGQNHFDLNPKYITQSGYQHNDEANPFEDTFETLDMTYNIYRTDDRKEWLTTITPETHLPREKGKPISCKDFINADVVLFSYEACERAIPSDIDGLKPVQRKILYTLFSKLGNRAYSPIKVFQLGGSVADFAQYHHGDQSMNEAIIKMTQDYVGSNNIPLLLKNGQTGTRLADGADHGAPRYVGCSLQKITRLIFPQIDDILLKRAVEDGQEVEPVYYIPIIPMSLVNGILGIGVGWKSDVCAYNPRDLINKVRYYINKRKNDVELIPWYRGFNGTIEKDTKGKKYIINGTIEKISSTKFVVTETPVPNYGFDTLEAKFKKLLKDGVISDYEFRVGNTINFPVTFVEPQDTEDVIKILGLSVSKSLSGLVLFNSDSKIKQYSSEDSIFNEWFIVREELYIKRKNYIIRQLSNCISKLENKIRFVKEMVGYDGQEPLSHTFSTYSNEEALDYLIRNKYSKYNNSYDYLMNIPARQFTKTNINKWLDELRDKRKELEDFKATEIEDIWASELDDLEIEWDIMEAAMNEHDNEEEKPAKKAIRKRK